MNPIDRLIEHLRVHLRDALSQRREKIARDARLKRARICYSCRQLFDPEQIHIWGICRNGHEYCPDCWENHEQSHREYGELMARDPNYFERTYGHVYVRGWVKKSYFGRGLECDRIIPFTDKSLRDNKDLFDPYKNKKY